MRRNNRNRKSTFGRRGIRNKVRNQQQLPVNYNIKISPPIGWNDSTNKPTYDGNDSLYKDLTGVLDINPSYVKLRALYSKVRINSVSIDFVPTNMTETTDAAQGVIIAAVTFGEKWSTDPELEDVNGFPGSVAVQTTRRTTHTYYNRDTIFYHTDFSTIATDFTPHVYFLQVYAKEPSETELEMMILRVNFSLTFKQRLL